MSRSPSSCSSLTHYTSFSSLPFLLSLGLLPSLPLPSLAVLGEWVKRTGLSRPLSVYWRRKQLENIIAATWRELAARCRNRCERLGTYRPFCLSYYQSVYLSINVLSYSASLLPYNYIHFSYLFTRSLWIYLCISEECHSVCYVIIPLFHRLYLGFV